MFGVELEKEYDVVVCGGGPSGIGAALGAAKSGAKTILIEKCAFLGGVGVASLNCILMPGYTDGKRDVIKGVYSEFIEKLKQRNAIFISNIGDPFDPEIAKFVLDEMFQEHEIDVLYHSIVTDVECNNNFITGIVVENKSGRDVIKGKLFIDSTGDGDLAARAGVPFTKGDDRGLMPVTTLYTVQNVDIEQFIKHYQHRFTDNKILYDKFGKVKSAIIYGFEKDEVKAAIENGDYSIPRENMCGIWTLPDHSGEVYVHATRVPNIDPLDAVQVSRAEFIGRKQVQQSFNFMKKYMKGFENCYLTKISFQIAVRQSRQIIGEYEITEYDLMNCKQFEDVIAQGTYGPDVHSSKSETDILKKLETGTHYDIPFRALIPSGMENLLVAGRCISGSVEAMSGFRVMPIAMAIGQGAGVAAGLCSRNGTTTRMLEYKKLENELLRQNVCLK
jgi:hypothetical protein